MFRSIEPEVAGQKGSETIMDTSVHPPIVKKLHYEFYGWLGDDILESFPSYIMSERLKNAVQLENLTGAIFDEVKITESIEFSEFYPDTELPKFYWAKITGKMYESDFSIGEDYRLMISEKAFFLLQQFNINHATIEEV